jgi:hypothetical protein
MAMEKIRPMQHVWGCDWCNQYVSKSNELNIFYSPLYGDLYDPNDLEYSKVVQEHVCNACWYKSLYCSLTSGT